METWRVVIQWQDGDEHISPLCDSEETARMWLQRFGAAYEMVSADVTVHKFTPKVLTMKDFEARHAD